MERGVLVRGHLRTRPGSVTLGDRGRLRGHGGLRGDRELREAETAGLERDDVQARGRQEGAPCPELLDDLPADARAYRAEVESSLRTGTYVDPGAGKLTVERYAEKWLETKRSARRPGTADRYEHAMRKHVTRSSAPDRWLRPPVRCTGMGEMTGAECWRLPRSRLRMACWRTLFA
ncbi:hypothetical protein GCM10010123_12530 [Pilimelia anulata]|uniref:Core-binding (CB) domain-containing protein n=1 Tax=Pilimelia anulata TaxID=53371 RepID=A0A8J3F821_9ACTN|nr:hypothetical protein GCM10010123_12530 [Pilimelia anulata]